MARTFGAIELMKASWSAAAKARCRLWPALVSASSIIGFGPNITTSALSPGMNCLLWDELNASARRRAGRGAGRRRVLGQARRVKREKVAEGLGAIFDGGVRWHRLGSPHDG